MTIASDYRHTVTITKQITVARGVRGQDVPAPTTLGTVPAKIENLMGRKLEIARQIVPAATHELTIRFLTGVTPNCQVHFGARTFDIGSVTNRAENNYEMTLLCVEAV